MTFGCSLVAALSALTPASETRDLWLVPLLVVAANPGLIIVDSLCTALTLSGAIFLLLVRAARANRR